MSDGTIYEAHPAADLFPMMTGIELQELVVDIKSHGLREPIALYENKILDGRNRLKACGLAGVDARYESARLNGSTPAEYVVSKNLRRRQLTKSQLAAVSVDLMPMLEEDARKRMAEGGRKHGHVIREGTAPAPDLPLGSKSNDLYGEARENAAKIMGVGARMISAAVAVHRADPELLGRVKSGKVQLRDAYKDATGRSLSGRSGPTPKAKTPEPKRQYAPPSPGTQRRTDCERRETERMVRGMSHIHGACRGLGGLRMELVVLSATDRKAWEKIAEECVKHLHAFIRRVRAMK